MDDEDEIAIAITAMRILTNVESLIFKFKISLPYIFQSSPFFEL